MVTRIELLQEYEAALIDAGGMLMPVDQVLAYNNKADIWTARGDKKSAVIHKLTDTKTGKTIWEHHICYYTLKGKQGNEQFLVYDPTLVDEKAYWLNDNAPRVLLPQQSTEWRQRIAGVVSEYVANKTLSIQDAQVEAANEAAKTARVRVWRKTVDGIEEKLIVLRDDNGSIEVVS